MTGLQGVKEPEHKTYAADHPDRGAMVGCSCGWRRWVDEAPPRPPDADDFWKLNWLLDSKEEHEGRNQ